MTNDFAVGHSPPPLTGIGARPPNSSPLRIPRDACFLFLTWFGTFGDYIFIHLTRFIKRIGTSAKNNRPLGTALPQRIYCERTSLTTSTWPTQTLSQPPRLSWPDGKIAATTGRSFLDVGQFDHSRGGVVRAFGRQFSDNVKSRFAGGPAQTPAQLVFLKGETSVSP
jgi:hypothetical protein